MLHDQRFLGARLKVSRAFALLGQLKADCAAWESQMTLEFAHSQDKSGWHVWSARPLESPPPVLGLQLCEIAYHLRSALDHAAYALVVAGGGTPHKQTSFPVSLTEHSWNSQGHRYLKGATEASVAVAKEWQPFHRSPELPHGDLLAAINEICLVDKHRQLVPTAAAVGMHSLYVESTSEVATWRRLAVQNREEDFIDLSTSQWVFKVFMARLDAPNIPDPTMPTPHLVVDKAAPMVAFNTHFPYELKFGLPAFTAMCRHVRRVLLHLEKSAPQMAP